MYGQPEITEYTIKCEECGKLFKKITSAHTKRLHHLTIPEYKKKWGYCNNQPIEAFYIKKLRQEYEKRDNARERVMTSDGRQPFPKGHVTWNKDRPVPEQMRARLEAMKINVQSTDSFRKKQSEAGKRKWQNPEYRKKSITTYKKIYNTPEAKERMRQQSLKGWANPEQRKEASEHRKRIWNTPEKKKFASERSKKMWAKRKLINN